MIEEKEIVRYLDQTNLHPNATTDEISKFIKEAKESNFYGVAIMPSWIPLAADILKGSNTRIVAAIGFPVGTGTTEDKVEETKWAIKQCEGKCKIDIDMVMNISLLKSGRYKEFREDMAAVVKAADGKTVKVIIEVGYLTREEIAIASLMAEAVGANFVKTSTGFKQFDKWRPSTAEDVRLIRSIVGEKVQVKIAGGVRTYEQALAVIEAGATRIGTSSGIAIKAGYLGYKKLIDKKPEKFL
ncbi:MAG: deoxyribose-phosphate aldolase [Tepidanaerobacteraceae bacterium]